jgi:prephenate dehydrogenase
MIDTLCIIGVGLIGGSLARALRDAGLVRRVVGCGRDPGNLARAIELGVIDHAESDPAKAVAGADMVVVAVTLGATQDILSRIAPALDPAAIVTDVGSAKACVVAAARATLSTAALPRFVPGHPIAGAEKSGVEASNARLFERHRVILTPIPEQSPDALSRVTRMWEAAGATVLNMDPDLHDQVLAATSHLPHLLAYAMVNCLLEMETPVDVFDYAAGGFRDFTRIASSNPPMWRDIALANAPALIAMCDRFERSLGSLREALERGDGSALEAAFARAKRARDDFMTRSGRA